MSNKIFESNAIRYRTNNDYGMIVIIGIEMLADFDIFVNKNLINMIRRLPYTVTSYSCLCRINKDSAASPLNSEF